MESAPGFTLSLSYATVSVLLTPQPPAVRFPRVGRQELGWKLRIEAVQTAWGDMREERNRVQAKGKAGGADNWALEEVADWIKSLLVRESTLVTVSIDVNSRLRRKMH